MKGDSPFLPLSMKYHIKNHIANHIANHIEKHIIGADEKKVKKVQKR